MKTSLTEKTSPYKKDERYITGHGDVDSMILDFIDDSDILSLMQIKNVNKKIRPILESQEFFEKRINTRYPSLVRFKRRKENWRDYYIRSMKDIRTLKKDFNLDYPHRGTNVKSPKYYIAHLLKIKNNRDPLWASRNLLREVISLTVQFAAFEGYEKDLTEKLEERLEQIERTVKDEDIRDDEMIYILEDAVYTLFKEGNIPLYLRIKERFKKYEKFFHFVMIGAFHPAIYSGDTKVVDFIFDEYLKTHTEEEFREFLEIPLYEDRPTPNHEAVFSHIKNKYAKYL